MIGRELKKTISALIKSRISKINSSLKSIKADTASGKQPKLSIQDAVSNETTYSFDWDKDRSDYKLNLVTNSKGKVDSLESYPTGSFRANYNNGDLSETVAKDSYTVVEGNFYSLTASTNTQTKESNNQVDGNYTMKFSGDMKIYTSGTTITISGGSVSVQCSDMTVQASSIKLTASSTTITNVVPGGTSGFSCLPVCPFTGAPHTIQSAP